MKKKEPICVNSKGGRGGIEGLQPSRQDRVYTTRIAVAIATAPFFQPSYIVKKSKKSATK